MCENSNGDIKVDVTFENNSLWLSNSQICEIFGKAKSTISEHISHIFEEEELGKSLTVRKFRTVQVGLAQKARRKPPIDTQW